MTTIAINNGVVASDTQAQGAYIEPSDFQKIHGVGDSVLGGSGDASAILDFVEWYKNGKDPEKFPDIEGSECFAFNPSNEKIELYYRLRPIVVVQPYACGSGSQFAMGAMLAGATSEEAVEIASNLDPYTGGKIMTTNTETS